MSNEIQSELLENGVKLTPLQQEIITILFKKKAMTRGDIVKDVNKPRTNVYDALMGLMSFNIVIKTSRPTKDRGRPLVYFEMINKLK
jgi:predicted transcriptional regulator